MKTPDDVAEMLRLKAYGWGIKRFARELGCSHHTEKNYVASGGAVPFGRRDGRRRSTDMRTGCASASCLSARTKPGLMRGSDKQHTSGA